MRKLALCGAIVGALILGIADAAAVGHESLRSASPGGYPVECRGNACYQLGHRVAFIRSGAFTQEAERDCRAYGRITRVLPRRRDYLWQAISDPVPGAPLTADTFVCGPPGVNLSY
jgi:hypothetical protein